MSLKGKVALITGSSKGLGKEIAFQLGAEGAKVVFNYANGHETAAATFQEFQASGYDGLLIRADVSDEAEVERLVGEASKVYGGIDILVPNATPEQPQMPIEEYSWQHFERMLDFFVKSPYYLCRAVLPHMKAQKWGRIVNISSEVFEKGVPNFTAYVSAKGGQVGFSRSLARELAGQGITVNIVSPGWIPVERHAKDPQELKDAYLSTIPVGRWGRPGDVARAVLFFCQEENSFLTGQTLIVNGGNSEPG